MGHIKRFIASLFIALAGSIFPGIFLLFCIGALCALFNIPSTTYRIIICAVWFLMFLYLLYSYAVEDSGIKAQKSAILAKEQALAAEKKLASEQLAFARLKIDACDKKMKSLDSTSKVLAERDILLSQRENIIIENENALTHDYPWFARVFADYHYIQDAKAADYLRTKSHPAYTAAEKVSAISKEKRELLLKCKLYEYQLEYLDSLFPWLEDFKTLNPKEGAKYIAATDSEYDEVRNWLSPQEYAELSPSAKNQLALERYQERKRSDWDAGIEYERFVGYKYEQQGFRVKYFGATQGLEDMGRDLIAEKGNRAYIIQCKRWSKEKNIHEKHIFQLYGSTVLFSLESSKNVVGVFVTTTQLSELARKCADHLDIEVRENYPLDTYPLIKCNISKDGSKIYHLPFDQQYDRVRIIPDKGEFYASTVAEAEDAGFRRAKRWICDSQ